MDHNNFSFHEINRTVGQDEASNHLISEDGIKGIHKLEEAVASHGNSISSTKKGNRDKVEHQAPKYRDYHRFMGKKNGHRNIRFTRIQAYSVVCCNGNVTQFKEK